MSATCEYTPVLDHPQVVTLVDALCELKAQTHLTLPFEVYDDVFCTSEGPKLSTVDAAHYVAAVRHYLTLPFVVEDNLIAWMLVLHAQHRSSTTVQPLYNVAYLDHMETYYALPFTIARAPRFPVTQIQTDVDVDRDIVELLEDLVTRNYGPGVTCVAAGEVQKLKMGPRSGLAAIDLEFQIVRPFLDAVNELGIDGLQQFTPPVANEASIFEHNPFPRANASTLSSFFAANDTVTFGSNVPLQILLRNLQEYIKNPDPRVELEKIFSNVSVPLGGLKFADCVQLFRGMEGFGFPSIAELETKYPITHGKLRQLGLLEKEVLDKVFGQFGYLEIEEK